MPCQQQVTDCKGNFLMSSITKAFDYALKMGAHIVSCSFGPSYVGNGPTGFSPLGLGAPNANPGVIGWSCNELLLFLTDIILICCLTSACLSEIIIRRIKIKLRIKLSRGNNAVIIKCLWLE